MAREIDLDSELTDAEKQYLVDRNRWDDLAYNAEQTGGDPVRRGTNPVSPQADSARLGDQTVTQVPNGSNPAPASLGQRQRLAADGTGAVQIQFEDEDRPYEDWSKDDLQEQSDRRGISKSGNKQDLADRLRAWDEENREGGDDDSEDEGDDGEEDGDPDE